MTKKTLIRLIGAATCVAAMTTGWDAEAGWWRRHGSSGGSWGSHGSSGGSWGSHGSSGGSWGSHGSSGGSYSYSSHGSSGGSHGSSGGGYVEYHHHGHHHGHHHHHHAVIIDDHAVVHEKVIMNEVVKAAPADTATLVVEVPKDAKVFINGDETKAIGSTRRFVSKGLEADTTYQYAVRIVTADKEAAMEQTKMVKLSRGQSETVKFDAATATAVSPAAPKTDSVATTSGG